MTPARLLIIICALALIGCSVSGPRAMRFQKGVYLRGSLINDNPAGRLGWPIDTAEISSLFGPRGREFHDGLDFAAPYGTPVVAAHSGKVIFAGDDFSSYGDLVIIRGEDRLLTFYAHNSKIFVAAGQRVQRGDTIAAVGESGHATGPHLHFEVRLYATGHQLATVDPMPILRNLTQKPRYRINEGLEPILAKLRE